jgi:hypothetical protein
MAQMFTSGQVIRLKIIFVRHLAKKDCRKQTGIRGFNHQPRHVQPEFSEIKVEMNYCNKSST